MAPRQDKAEKAEKASPDKGLNVIYPNPTPYASHSIYIQYIYMLTGKILSLAAEMILQYLREHPVHPHWRIDWSQTPYYIGRFLITEEQARRSELTAASSIRFVRVYALMLICIYLAFTCAGVVGHIRCVSLLDVKRLLLIWTHYG